MIQNERWLPSIDSDQTDVCTCSERILREVARFSLDIPVCVDGCAATV